MFEIIAGIIAGLMVKNWVAFFAFPCIIGLIQTVTLALRPRRRRLTSGQVAQMRHDGMTDDDIREAQEGLDLLNRMAPGGWIIYPWQFAWSAITAFPFCLIVGGIKLLFFK
jgi:hypothetical protein